MAAQAHRRSARLVDFVFLCAERIPERGITSALIAAAVKAAKAAGAPALEAYPLDADLTPSASGTGYASTFARAGFKVVVATRRPARSCDPISGHRKRLHQAKESNDAERDARRDDYGTSKNSWPKKFCVDEIKLELGGGTPWTILRRPELWRPGDL